jgi:uncharacterized damage-inducible protein DinB
MNVPEEHLHNAWATVQLLEFCLPLSEEQLAASGTGTYGRIDDTLVHMVAAEHRYLNMLGGLPPQQPYKEGDRITVARLLEDARRHEQRWQAFFASIEPAELGEKTEAQRAKGRFRIRRSMLTTQAIDHATEHRTHVRTILTQLGMEPPDLDAWTYGDTTRAWEQID